MTTFDPTSNRKNRVSTRAQLIQQYEQIVEDECFSDEARGIAIPLLHGVLRALREGLGPEHFREERNINEQHMDAAYFRKIRWTWDRAIAVTQHDQKEQRP